MEKSKTARFSKGGVICFLSLASLLCYSCGSQIQSLGSSKVQIENLLDCPFPFNRYHAIISSFDSKTMILEAFIGKDSIEQFEKSMGLDTITSLDGVRSTFIDSSLDGRVLPSFSHHSQSEIVDSKHFYLCCLHEYNSRKNRIKAKHIRYHKYYGNAVDYYIVLNVTYDTNITKEDFRQVLKEKPDGVYMYLTEKCVHW